jgi:hypothetical protein
MDGLTLKHPRLEKIETEMNEKFDKENTTKSQRDSWVIARMTQEIINMESEYKDRIQHALDAQAETVRRYEEIINGLKRQIR